MNILVHSSDPKCRDHFDKLVREFQRNGHEITVIDPLLRVSKLSIIGGLPIIRSHLLRRRLNRLLAAIEKQCDFDLIDAMILDSDRVDDVNLALIKLKKVDCPLYLYSSCLPATAESLLYMRRKSLYRKFIYRVFWPSNRLCSQYCWDWVDKATYSFFPSWKTSVLEKVNMLPATPWIFGATARRVFFQSSRAKKIHLINGLNRSKAEISGRITIERQNISKEHLCKKYSLDLDKKLVVIALPQLKEHKILSDQAHWAVHKTILSAVAGSGANGLVSLHPKMLPTEYFGLVQSYGCVVLDESLDEIIGFADAFICSEGSSTADTADSIGKPVLLCGWFGLNYSNLYYSDNVMIVRSAADLSSNLDHMLLAGSKLEAGLERPKNAVEKIVQVVLSNNE